MRSKFLDSTKYFGFVGVGFEWLAFLSLLLIQRPDLQEPFSQYGIGETRVWFGISLTIASALIYLFMRHLDKYWSHSSFFGLLAGLLLTATGWVPYEPNLHQFVFDIHNLCVLLGLILYLVPVFFIAYSKKHRQIALCSRIIFYALAGFSALSIYMRINGGNVFFLQLISLILLQIWAVITNILLLQHHEQIANGHPKKL